MSERSRPAAMDPATIVATWFGVGFLPVAPGTWGSLAALPFAWGIDAAIGPMGLAVAAAAVFALGVWASDGAVRRLGGKDPGPVVVDEVVGQWIVLIAIPPNLVWYAAAFVVFRVFDIAKPWPVSWADRHVAGGLGIMLDDVFAGVYGAATIVAARFATGI